MTHFLLATYCNKMWPTLYMSSVLSCVVYCSCTEVIVVLTDDVNLLVVLVIEMDFCALCVHGFS